MALDKVEAYIEDERTRFGVKGVAVAVVQGDEVLLEAGFGTADEENGREMTADTVLAIGSSTKAFTATALGCLVDEGLLEWDKPIREYIPGFRMHDPVATEHLTVRDMLSHRSGLPRHDMLWYGNDKLTRAEVVERLRYLEPSKSFRALWQYNNLMYLTAGHLIEILSGQTWEEAVQSRILDKLGMGSTSFTFDTARASGKLASPYSTIDDEVRLVPHRALDLAGPAGSINSTVGDLAKWLQCNVGGGTREATEVITSATLRQIHAPTMVMPEGPSMWDETYPGGYGMGWFLENYRGVRVVHHGGNIDGFSALVAFAPKERIGVAVLANMNATSLPTVATYRALDELLGLDPLPWGERYKGYLDAMMGGAKEAREIRKTKAAGAPASHDAGELIGEYAHPGYGPLAVSFGSDGATLEAHYNNLDLVLTHRHFDVFDARYETLGVDLEVTFLTASDGTVAGLKIPLEGTVDPIQFERQPDRSLADPAILAGYRRIVRPRSDHGDGGPEGRSPAGLHGWTNTGRADSSPGSGVQDQGLPSHGGVRNRRRWSGAEGDSATGRGIRPGRGCRLMASFDVVISGGEVIDGTGAPRKRADVGILQGRISAIGDLSGAEAAETVDANNKVITPGFIDVHAHTDLAAELPDRYMAIKTASLLQGVTTEVSGNCGFTPYPRRPDLHEEFRSFLSGLFAEERGGFEHYAEYCEAVSGLDLAVNLAPLVGHGSIRAGVIGMEDRPATPEELDQMRHAADRAFSEGAFGLSSGLIYTPGVFGGTDEVSALAAVAGSHGRPYATHMRDESDRIIEAIQEALQIGREGNTGVEISHHKLAGRNNWGRSEETLALLQSARDSGVDVTIDVYPYTAGSTYLAAVLPPWANSGGADALISRLNDPATRKQISEEVEEGSDEWQTLVDKVGWEAVVIATTKGHPQYEGRSVASIAETMGVEPFDAACTLLLADPKLLMIIHMMEEADVQQILAASFAMIGSDGVPTPGKPHPRIAGTFAKVLGHYSRELGLFSLEEAVRKMTSLPADRFNLGDRGRVSEGKVADLVVVDPATVIDRATYDSPLEAPLGIPTVIVGGQVAVRDGNDTGLRTGGVLTPT